MLTSRLTRMTRQLSSLTVSSQGDGPMEVGPLASKDEKGQVKRVKVLSPEEQEAIKAGFSCIKSMKILSCMLVDDRSAGHDPPEPDGCRGAEASERSSPTQVARWRPITFQPLNIEPLIYPRPSQDSSRDSSKNIRIAAAPRRSQHLNRAVMQHKSPTGSPCRFEFLKAFILDPDLESIEIEPEFKE